MKTPVILYLVCGLTLIASLTCAQQSTTTTTTTTTYVPTSTVVGARVMGSQGDQVGQISDVVLDKQSGCMAYIVLATDQGGTRKLVAAPWTIFTPGSDSHTYTVTVDRQKIYSAPVWESSRMAEYSTTEWVGNVYSYYGVQPEAGLNIHTNVGVSTQGREEMNANTRVRQTGRTEDQMRAGSEETRTQRNADTLTRPSPGRNGRQSDESKMDQTRADDQGQREARRQRREQRAEARSNDRNSRADEARSNPAEDRAEHRAEPQSSPANTQDAAEPSQSHDEGSMRSGESNRPERQSQSTNARDAADQQQPASERPQSNTERPNQSGDMDQNRTQTSSNRPRHESNDQQSGQAEGRARSHSHRDQQSKPGAQASPTP